MGLFGFGKKKEEATGGCSCGGACATQNNATEASENARFIVLGACCKKSTETFENVKTAVAELGYTDEVLNIGDNVEIAKYGVMQTPALVVNNKVVAYGRAIKTEDAKTLIQEALS